MSVVVITEINRDILYNPSIKNKFEAVKQAFYDHGIPLTNEVCCTASYEENMEMLVWAFNNGSKLCPDCLRTAFCTNNNLIIKWLIDNKCPVDPTILLDCIFLQNLEYVKIVVEYDLSKKYQNGIKKFLMNVDKNSNIRKITVEIVEYLISVYGIKWISKNPSILSWSAVCGDIELFNLCFPYITYRYRRRNEEDIPFLAAKNGQLEFLKHLKSSNSEIVFDEWVIKVAIMQNDFETVKWLINNGSSPYSKNKLLNFVKAEHLELSEEIVSYLNQLPSA